MHTKSKILSRIMTMMLLMIASGMASCSAIQPDGNLTVSSTGLMNNDESVLLLPAQVNPTRYDIVTQTLDSPDESWRAEVSVATPNQSLPDAPRDYYQQLTIASADGTQRYAPIRTWSPFGLGWDAPRLERWSNDGQSLYFTTAGFGDGCGVFSSGSNLQRFNTADNTITRLLFNDRWATFSPAEKSVAYLEFNNLVIQDLETGEQKRIDNANPVPIPSGHIVWSPDGKMIAYTIANSPCMNGWADSTTLVVVDTSEMTQRELLTNDKRRFVTVKLNGLDSLIVTDFETVSYSSLNLQTGEIQAAGERKEIATVGEWVLQGNTLVGGLTAQRKNGELMQSLLPPDDFVGATLPSPNGRYLLIWHGINSASALADGLPLSIFDGETGTLTRLAATALYNPQYFSWNHEGSQLVFTAGGGREAQRNKWLNLFDAATGKITALIRKDVQIPGIVAQSPKGDWIAYAAIDATEATDDPLMTFANPGIAARRIWLLNPQTGERKRLNALEEFQDAPVWSENGATLFYVQRQGTDLLLAATDWQTGKTEMIEASRQPAPEAIGYYGQSDWSAILAFRAK